MLRRWILVIAIIISMISIVAGVWWLVAGKTSDPAFPRTLDPQNNYQYKCSGTNEGFFTYNKDSLTEAQYENIKKRYPSIWNQPNQWACVQGCSKGSCSRMSANPDWWK